MEFKNIDELLERPETIMEIPERVVPEKIIPAKKQKKFEHSALQSKISDLFEIPISHIIQGRLVARSDKVKTFYIRIGLWGLEMSKLRELEEYIPGYSLQSIEAHQYEDEDPEYTIYFHEDSE